MSLHLGMLSLHTKCLKKEENMGMTNEQFFSYQKSLLRQLERIEEDLPDIKEKKYLTQLIKDIKESLEKP